MSIKGIPREEMFVITESTPGISWLLTLIALLIGIYALYQIAYLIIQEKTLNKLRAYKKQCDAYIRQLQSETANSTKPKENEMNQRTDIVNPKKMKNNTSKILSEEEEAEQLISTLRKKRGLFS